MKRNPINVISVINIACAILMLGLLICQFVPFWNMDGQEVSIGGYAWFPTDHSDFTAHFQQLLETKEDLAGGVALINTIVLLVGAAGLIFCLKNSADVWPAVFPTVCGVTIIVGYIVRPVFRLGAMWQLHVVLAIVMLAMAIFSFGYWLKKVCHQK